MTMNRSTPGQAMTQILRRKVAELHEFMVREGLLGDLPQVNAHYDRSLPGCFYLGRTNSVVVCLPTMLDLGVPGAVEALIDAMAMCACRRQYQFEMRVWNLSQNKARIQAPVQAMAGTPKWEALRKRLTQSSVSILDQNGVHPGTP